MKLYLIDPTGEVWRYPARGLAAAIGRANSDIDIWDYAISRLGALEIAIDAQVATLSWRAALVTKKMAAAAESLLAELAPHELRFRSDISIWIEIFHSPFQLGDRLRLGCLPETAEAPRPAFATEALPFDRISFQPLNSIESDVDRMALFLNWWRARQGHCSQAELLEFVYRFDLIDRASAVVRGMDGELRFVFTGSELDIYRRYDPSWPTRSMGRHFLDQPDVVYGAWCARNYRQVLATNQPRFDAVDATVRLPGLSPQHARYERLLLPWTAPDGTMMAVLLAYKRPPEKRRKHALRTLRVPATPAFGQMLFPA
jgi:hypothetical protein